MKSVIEISNNFGQLHTKEIFLKYFELMPFITLKPLMRVQSLMIIFIIYTICIYAYVTICIYEYICIHMYTYMYISKVKRKIKNSKNF